MADVQSTPQPGLRLKVTPDARVAGWIPLNPSKAAAASALRCNALVWLAALNILAAQALGAPRSGSGKVCRQRYRSNEGRVVKTELLPV